MIRAPLRAVALAMAMTVGGWYLMAAPPVSENCVESGDRLCANPTRPIGEWSVWQSFDTAVACETARRARREKFSEQQGLRGLMLWGLLCIATDDPRLK
jgi:hypothetical protein